ncbi:MAG: hypothetical protein JWN72_605 [Thermoleophilia bacterium]|nr:hypothetical protein [Thermoleophilia bacterium]
MTTALAVEGGHARAPCGRAVGRGPLARTHWCGTVQTALQNVRAFNHTIQLGVQPGFTQPIADHIQEAYDARNALSDLAASLPAAQGAAQLVTTATSDAARAHTMGVDAAGMSQLRQTWSSAEQAVSALLDAVGGSSDDAPRPRGI